MHQALARPGPARPALPARKPGGGRPRRGAPVAGLFKRSAEAAPAPAAPPTRTSPDAYEEAWEPATPPPPPPPPGAPRYSPSAAAPAAGAGSPYATTAGAGQSVGVYPQGDALPPLPPPGVSGGGGGSSLPAWLWIAVGALGATLYHKAASAVRGPAGGMGGGVQGKMAGMMMEQMMKQAMKQQQAAGGGAGLGGGMPPPPFPGFPGFPPPPPPPAGAAAGASAGPASSSPPIDTTAGPPAGSKFAEAKAREAAVKAATAGAGGGGGVAGAGADGAPPASTSPPPSSSSSTPPPKAASTTTTTASTSSAFKDVADEPAATGSGSGGVAGDAGGPAASTSAAAGGSGAAGSGSSKFSSDLVDQFFRDPSVQEMLYQHLPEPMRNPATFEWVLNNPENRAQLEAMIDAQGASLDPRMKEMLSQIDNEEVGKRLESLGVSPADMLQKIMGEPELAAAIQKPQVMKAIMEMQTNPMAFLNYQGDPDVMLVMNKLTAMFNPAAAGAGVGGGGGIPGMPGSSAT